jgi:hypothetical protein
MFIEMECNRCSVAKTCPRRGSSPISVEKAIVKCKIIGGFGRTPVDRTVLSEESIARVDRDGPCLTIAEVPDVDEQGYVTFTVVKVFSPPCLSDREKNVIVTSSDVTTRPCK